MPTAATTTMSERAGGRVGVLSLPMFYRVPGLARFLGDLGAPVWLSGLLPPAADITHIAGWGRKPIALRAMHYAARWKRPFVTLEDGFMRSVGLGVRGVKPLALALDHRGVYYDPDRPSDLEALIVAAAAAPAAAAERGRDLIGLMRRHGIGKYNEALDLPDDDPAGRGRPLILVVDQTRGDAAVVAGGAGPADFLAMLDAALAEHPGADIRVRVHPDVLAGRRQGYLADAARIRNVPLEARAVAWPSLARRAAQVYVVSSLAGCEALIQGVPVTCFGRPFYAGWGLTDDRCPLPRRTARPTLDALVGAAYFDYCRYLDPLTDRPVDALTVARHIARLRERDRRFAGNTVVVGLRPWKRANVRPYLAGRHGRLSFTADLPAALRRVGDGPGRVVTWAASEPAGIAAAAAAAGVDHLRIEDGFLRSVGLGSNHVAAASLVFDARGIYFDPRQPSDLEVLLAETCFDEGQLAEAGRLIALIVARQLSKYNVGRSAAALIAAPAGRWRILVPGQVEDDASVRLGAAGMGGNLGLLKAVRARAPDAWVVYKPHPDVEAGNRIGAIPSAISLRYADQVVDNASVVSLFGQVDAIHTMTSLVGFEGLLRGLPVVTYGQPFYAGWGLTEDRDPPPRRGRILPLEALVAGALMLYPRYVDPDRGLPCDVWHVVDSLSRSGPRPVSRSGAQLRRGAALVRAMFRSLGV